MDQLYTTLLKELQGGDNDAYKKLYECLKREAFSVAYSQLFDFQLAEDAVQEAFIRLCSVARNYTGKGAAKSFILGVVKNTAREIRRKRLLDWKYNTAQKEKSTDHSQDDYIYMKQIVALLKKPEREVVLLHLQADLTFKEISMLLSVPESTLKYRYSKGIERLQAIYAADTGKEAEV